MPLCCKGPGLTCFAHCKNNSSPIDALPGQRFTFTLNYSPHRFLLLPGSPVWCFFRFTLGLPGLPDLPIQFRHPCLLLPAALGLLALLAINNNSSPIDALPGRRFTFIKHVPANLLLLYDSTVGRPFKNKPKCHQFGSMHYVYNNNEPSLVHTMLLFLYIAFKLDFAIVLSITLQSLMGIR